MSLVLLFIAASCFVVFAQSAPKNEVFGGYSLFNADTGSSHVGLNGWNASATHFVTRNLGITADFSGAYGSPAEFGSVSSNVHNFMFGPTVAVARNKKVTPFAHALFGVSHIHQAASTEFGEYNDHAFALALGGGVDANVNKHFGVRVAQLDYVYSNFADTTQNNWRYSGGVVFHF
ncbi:MAG TPA: outer membrane beta-barrel protein [Terriglobales bacterium]